MNLPKIAVIGVGGIGRHHARILAGLPTADLVAVVDTDLDAAGRAAGPCTAAPISDYHDVLPMVDAVTIAVPTRLHASIATECLSRGTAVLIEKPITADLDDAARLVELAERTGTLLQVGHVERFNPAYEVAAREIDQPRYIRAERFSQFTFRSTDIGVVHDLLIHDLDLVLDLVGQPVREATAFGITVMGGGEDCVQARLVFDNGCLADLSASRVHPEPRRTLSAWSRDGCVNVDLQQRHVTTWRPSSQLLHGRSPIELAARPDADIDRLKSRVFGEFLAFDEPVVPEQDALTAELSEFVECIRNQTAPRVGGREALRSMAVADRLLESIAAHEWDGHADGPIGPRARRRYRRAG